MKKTIELRVRRIFSETLKRKIVHDIEKGKASIMRVMGEYDVRRQTVYKWLNKYSRHLQSNKTIVIQMDSEAYKTKELENRIKELEAALGRKQLEVDYLNKMIELGKEKLGVDLKKKLEIPPLSGSGPISSNTDTK
jgi:transposase